jgi:hypothetical protein
MIADARWDTNWSAVAPPESVRVDLGPSATKRREARRTIEALPAGTPVVIRASALGAIGLDRFVSQAGLGVEREYLAFPSARAPAYLVEDARAAIRLFVAAVIVTPPRTRTRFSTPIGAALAVLRALKPWRLVGRIAPGRVVVTRRT